MDSCSRALDWAWWHLVPRSEETNKVIGLLTVSRFTQTLWVKRAQETAVDDPVDAICEAVEMEMDAGAIPGLVEKWERHRIDWNHVRYYLRAQPWARLVTR